MPFSAAHATPITRGETSKAIRLFCDLTAVTDEGTLCYATSGLRKLALKGWSKQIE